MGARVWGTSSDGLIEYKSLTRNTLPETLDLIRWDFFMNESLSKALNLPKDRAAIIEMDQIILKAAKDGVSLVGIEKATGRVVACMINKINVKDDEKSVFEATDCQRPSARAYLKLNSELDKLADCFCSLQSNCYLECMFGSVLPEFRKNGVCGKLIALSIELVRHLKTGENVKISLDGEILPLHPVPTAVVTVATSLAVEKIMMKLGFVQIFKVGSLEKQLLLKAINGTELPNILIAYKPMESKL